MAKVEGKTGSRNATATTGDGSKNDNGNDPLLLVDEEEDEEELGIDPTLLASLSEGERREALAAARAARRAEERAAMRIALESKRREREELRRRERERAGEWAERIAGELGNNEKRRGGAVAAGEGRRSGESSGGGGAKGGDEDDGPTGAAANGAGANGNGNGSGKVTFMSKRQREAMKQRQQAAAADEEKRQKAKASGDLAAKTAARRDKGGSSSSSSHRSKRPRQDGPTRHSAATAQKSSSSPSSSSHLTEAERMEIKRTYLGENAAASLGVDPREEQRRQLAAKKKKRAAKKITFKFAWDDADDTLGAASSDPLYDMTMQRTTGRGRESANDGRRGTNRRDAQARHDRGGRSGKKDVAFIDDVNTKPISEMTPRDWRILRENYDIRVRGGRAPPPLRSFRESTSPDLPTIHPAILDAVENTLNYREPSPIQRQAIPIGLQRRDLIGIAETGSGKTAAFGIPLCHYLLTLPKSVLDSVADEGPLALVMAPTRELALQIDVEMGKILSKQEDVSTLAVVGGQAIQTQAYKLRNGVHVVVGTPGRINDCIETAYLVLNQCSYIVLDEADRMIDLGFAPQIEQILESMGGSLKSEDEAVAYRQEEEDLRALMKKGGGVDGSGGNRGVPRHRLTAMFSATMPSEVERIAQRYLRHPAVVSIGDRDSVKNARIVQRVLFLPSAAKKEHALRDILVRARHDEKIIVFVNEKKHAEGVGRMVERSGKRCVVLHGGKAQDQREESLEAFRKGGVVMVATDVAGRGLDIPNVSQIVNFDLPSRSIDNYCHRIGRTGRAGKEGLATSFITDADEGIMAPLKQYLESTGSTIPDKLARHPAAAAGGVLGGNLTV